MVKSAQTDLGRNRKGWHAFFWRHVSQSLCCSGLFIESQLIFPMRETCQGGRWTV